MEYVKECGQIKKQEKYVLIDSIGYEKRSADAALAEY